MKKKIDWVTIIATSLIFLSMILIAYYMLQHDVQDCTSDPFGYGIEKLKDEIDSKDIFGTIYVVTNDGQVLTQEI